MTNKTDSVCHSERSEESAPVHKQILRFAQDDSHRHRPGFTFMEILFAVMILGIGFIMVAAMFPAALRQTQANVEVTAFNSIVAKAQQDFTAAAYMLDPSWNYAYQQKTEPTAPSRFLDLMTGWLVNDNTIGLGEPWDYDPSNAVAPQQWGRPIPFSFHDPRFLQRFPTYMTAATKGSKGTYTTVDIQNYLWDIVRGNLIVPDKREYAYVPLWSRGVQEVKNSNPVQLTADASLNLFIIPVRSRAKPQYDPFPTDASGNANPACDVAFNFANLDPQIIEFNYYPPASTNVNPAAPYGVLKLTYLYELAGMSERTPYGQAPATPTVNPLAEGAFVIVSDSDSHITPTATNQYPKAFNGMIFKLGLEVADQSGTAGSSNGAYWAVAEIDNMPSEQPFNITKASQIDPTAFSAQQIYGLVVGRQPDPGDSMQHNPATNRTTNANKFLNRTGPAQELGGVIVTSVPLK